MVRHISGKGSFQCSCIIFFFWLFVVLECFYYTDNHSDSDPNAAAVLDELTCFLPNLILHFLPLILNVCSKYTNNLVY